MPAPSTVSLVRRVAVMLKVPPSALVRGRPVPS